MSSDEKKPLAEARDVALEMVFMLGDVCKDIQVAGSVRRGKAMVGDIEIVALPKHKHDLHSKLETMLHRGTISKAFYGISNTNRWGEKYKGMMYKGFKVEVFSADEHNWGYVYWLRTGPAESNAWVMQRLLVGKSPYRPNEGYFWVKDKKVSVPDEKEMFRLLGMPFVEPPSRTLDRYEQGMRWFKPADKLQFVVDNTPKQNGLF